jgi:hypothetical protein
MTVLKTSNPLGTLLMKPATFPSAKKSRIEQRHGSREQRIENDCGKYPIHKGNANFKASGDR